MLQHPKKKTPLYGEGLPQGGAQKRGGQAQLAHPEFVRQGTQGHRLANLHRDLPHADALFRWIQARRGRQLTPPLYLFSASLVKISDEAQRSMVAFLSRAGFTLCRPDGLQGSAESDAPSLFEHDGHEKARDFLRKSIEACSQRHEIIKPKHMSLTFEMRRSPENETPFHDP